MRKITVTVLALGLGMIATAVAVQKPAAKTTVAQQTFDGPPYPTCPPICPPGDPDGGKKR